MGKQSQSFSLLHSISNLPDRNRPWQDSVIAAARASGGVFPHVPDELFLARDICLAGPTGTVVGVDRDLVAGRKGHEVVVFRKGPDDEPPPVLERRRVAQGRLGVHADPGPDPTVLAICHQPEHDVDSRFLQGAHEIVVVCGRIDGVQPDGVDAEVPQVCNVFSPPLRKIVRIEIDGISIAQWAVVRAWIVCDSLDRNVFVIGGVIEAFPFYY